MQQIEQLIPGKFYHIYNRGINSCDIFTETANYEYFLGLYDKYISSIADTYAWVLMKNHFHLLVRVKDEEEIAPMVVLNPIGGSRHKALSGTIAPAAFKHKALSGSKTTERAAPAPPAVPDPGGGFKFKPIPSHQFSHLFNAYAQAFNKRNDRTGSLFEHPFKRKLIDEISYFKTMVVYIHNNPVHHGIRQHAMDYLWSSYLTCVSIKPTHLQRDAVMGWFDDQAEFKAAHNNDPGDIIDLENWLELS